MDISELTADEQFTLLFADFIDELRPRLTAELRDRLALTLQAGASEVTQAKVRDLAGRQADTLITRLAETELRKSAAVIAEGIADGQNPRAIARRLEEVRGLDRNRAATYSKYREYLDLQDLPRETYERRLERQYQRLLRDRRETIARTEARYGTSEARRFEAEQRGARWKSWVTNGDDRVSDVCASNEAAGVIAIDEDFPSGVAQPPAHPNCRCTVAYVASERVRDLEEERAAGRIEATQLARESVLAEG